MSVNGYPTHNIYNIEHVTIVVLNFGTFKLNGCLFDYCVVSLTIQSTLKVFQVARSITPHIAYYLPRNIGIDQVCWCVEASFLSFKYN